MVMGMGFQKFLLKNSRPGVDCELVLNQNHSKLLPDNQLQMEQYELSPLPENLFKLFNRTKMIDYTACGGKMRIFSQIIVVISV
jgi:hypothetical protein